MISDYSYELRARGRQASTRISHLAIHSFAERAYLGDSANHQLGEPHQFRSAPDPTRCWIVRCGRARDPPSSRQRRSCQMTSSCTRRTTARRSARGRRSVHDKLFGDARGADARLWPFKGGAVGRAQRAGADADGHRVHSAAPWRQRRPHQRSSRSPRRRRAPQPVRRRELDAGAPRRRHRRAADPAGARRAAAEAAGRVGRARVHRHQRCQLLALVGLGGARGGALPRRRILCDGVDAHARPHVVDAAEAPVWAQSSTTSPG